MNVRTSEYCWRGRQQRRYGLIFSEMHRTIDFNFDIKTCAIQLPMPNQKPDRLTFPPSQKTRPTGTIRPEAPF